jgi:ribosomal peptide maturation radical SAM protein 1
MAPQVLLISPPWRTPNYASLALGTLRPLLERQGIEAQALYGNLLFPVTVSPLGYLELYASFLFLPWLYPQVSPEAAVDAMLAQLRDEHALEGVRQGARIDEGLLREHALLNIRNAGICIERCVARAASPEFDVVLLSATFETQLPAALAIARRLKARRPDVRVALGGAACFAEQGLGLQASFPALDAVCYTEGEAVVGPLVRALRGELPLSQVPGIAYRGPDGAVHRTAQPPLLTDLDELPVPAYEDFIAQFEQSGWHGLPGEIGAPYLFFETSRGCWWGQKHLCSFCGLNAEELRFRRKSPDRVFGEIRHLHERYPTARSLQATDNILDMAFLKDPLPRLAALARDPARPLRMFFEVKSNLRRDQVQVLADAGITEVQPGIESFSDEILANMDKGATGLGQVQFLKHAEEAGINVIYNILLRNPGDRAAYYREMLALLPALRHLPPPNGVVTCLLQRFSPYQRDPARYGIRDLRPKAYYAQLFPDPAVDLQRIAYLFDYDHDMLRDEELRAAQRELVEALLAWHRDWPRLRGLAYYRDTGDALLLHDRRDGARGPESVRLVGVAAALYRYLDQVRTRAALRERFAGCDEALVEALLDGWLHRRFICRDRRGRLLAVLPRRGPAPASAMGADDGPGARNPARRLALAL